MKWTNIIAQVMVAIFGLVSMTRPAMAQLKIPEELKVRPNRLAKIEASCNTPVRWINLHDDIDLIPDSSGKFATILGVRAGRFKIAAYTASKDGTPSEPAYCTIIVEGAPPPDKPTPPQPTPPAKIDSAILRLRFGSSGCTATIVGPRRSDGRWDVLTAAHCTGTVGSKGEVTLADGRKFPVVVAVRNTTADISWMIADINEPLDGFAMLAAELPAVGVSVWHKGYGVDKPGNKEVGVVASSQDSNGQLKMVLSVSSGDSGSGIFRVDTNELVAVVCCTASMARKGNMWGGSCRRAAEIRPKQAGDFHQEHDIEPLPMPFREDDEERIVLPFMHLAGNVLRFRPKKAT